MTLPEAVATELTVKKLENSSQRKRRDFQTIHFGDLFLGKL